MIYDAKIELYSILVDESCDVSMKEQMVIVLWYIDKKEFVIGRFLGLVHDIDTTINSLKKAIYSLFSKYDLSISSLWGTVIMEIVICKKNSMVLKVLF